MGVGIGHVVQSAMLCGQGSGLLSVTGDAMRAGPRMDSVRFRGVDFGYGRFPGTGSQADPVSIGFT